MPAVNFFKTPYTSKAANRFRHVFYTPLCIVHLKLLKHALAGTQGKQ